LIWHRSFGEVDRVRFIGTHFQTVDPKGRVALPAKFKRLLRPEDQETLVLTMGRERCLLLYPLSEWTQLAEALDVLPRNQAKREAIRSISDHTTELELDANGRITIPREFLQRAAVERDVAIVGSLRYVEVWPRPAYEEGMAARREASSDILDQLF
jgi:MraZ protein